MLYNQEIDGLEDLERRQLNIESDEERNTFKSNENKLNLKDEKHPLIN